MHHDMMRKGGSFSDFIYTRSLGRKEEDSVVVEAGNIGYRIFIPSSVLGTSGLGEEVKIYTIFPCVRME